MIIFHFKIPKTACYIIHSFVLFCFVFTISNCKPTNIFKEPDTTREVFPELKSREASLEIPEPPSAKGTNSCYETLNKKTFHFVLVKCSVFYVYCPNL